MQPDRIRPFRIHIEDAVLDDLRMRLGRTRRHAALSRNWSHGTDPAFLDDLLGYWARGYDWREQEAVLNGMSHHMADVGGTPIHFVHEKGHGAGVTPLLLLHGWPDSFLRYQRVLPRLVGAFDVVVPSLPGFAFTGPVKIPESVTSMRHYADLLWCLMTQVLGYETFAVSGGDGGSPLAQIIAIDHPDSVIGVHLTDLGWHAANADPEELTKEEQHFLKAAQKQFMTDGAYGAVQTTTPQSLAPALNESPAGLASWILDRFHSWTDGDIEKVYGRDALLTNIMLYWTTQTIGPSMLGYFLEARTPTLTTADYVERPVGLALFPKDGPGAPPRSFAERTLNVKRYTEMPRGGHFGAWEQPELFADDLTEFFAELGQPDPVIEKGQGTEARA